MHLEEQRGNWVEELDPRMKILLILVYTLFTFLSFDSFVLIINYALILALFFGSRLFIKGLKVLTYITTLMLLDAAGARILDGQVLVTFKIMIQLLQRFSAFLVLGIWMAGRLRVGDFVTAMEKIRIPKGITITAAVTFRHLPTVRQEFYYIKNTMKLRGIGINFRNVILHPVKTMEYSIVPLIIRSFTIADELAASAMTRGLDLEAKRISYHDVRIKASDILMTLLFTTAVVLARLLGPRLRGVFF